MATQEFITITKNLTFLLAALTTPTFVWACIFAPQIFPYAFGPAWAEAGLICSALIAVAFLMVFTSWPERVFEVAGKQGTLFRLQISFDALSVLAVLGCLEFLGDPLKAIFLYVGVAVLFNLIYLKLAFNYAGLSNKIYWHFLIYIGCLGCIAALSCEMFKHSALPVYSSWILSLIVVISLVVLAIKANISFFSRN